jgi:CRISPR-associated endonuclease Csn1
MITYELKKVALQNQTDEIVWAFDLGKGSLGEAVRRGNEFLHKASLLIPAEFAETKTAATRRRMMRTRQAHKAREEWLEKVMGDAGIEVLKGRRVGKVDGKWKQTAKGDYRLEREFPPRRFQKNKDGKLETVIYLDGKAKDGAPARTDVDFSTCYNSALLRIKLLRGEKLEPWQVFKAFHSAIQRRGYDKDIPWKTRESRTVKKDGDEEDAGTEKRMHDFELMLEKMAPGKTEFQFPAYFDAREMGLWHPDQPDELKLRSDCHAKTTRNQIAPRKLVEAEIRKLVEGGAKHYPTLAGKSDYLLYGPAQQSYASYKPELRQKFNLREGGSTDWQGVVGQKLPRFENRIIAKCALIPRLNVCKLREGEKGQPHEKSLVAVEVAFLMKLKNHRIQRPGGLGWLSAVEIRSILEDPKRKDWKFTKSAWKKHCISIGAIPLPGHEEIDSPRFSGRSRFCRPALEVLKRLILSGEKPSEFLKEETQHLNGNKDPLKGLVEADLKFIADMAAKNDAWESIYIPNQQLDALTELSNNSDEAITRLIGQQNDPIVRHRLSIFYKRLCELEKATNSRPDQVVLEFVREDFMGKKAKLEYNSFIKRRAEERIKAREEAAKVGVTEKSAGLKLELLRAQDGCCLYTNEGLVPSKLDEYQIEHIVPRSKGGPDAVVNYVLTTQKTNDAKADRTPYDWFHQEMPDKWDAYVNRVRARATHLRNKKVQLLIALNAAELADKYTALAETAWIAKLAQAIVGLHFGWRNGVDENGNKRVTVISGGLTGRIRRKYALNQILNPNAKTEEEAEKKNRDDDRHHALDAMVISFISNWARDAKKENFFRFPEAIHKNARGFFEKEIASVIPQSLCFEKAALAETIYGARGDGEDKVIVQRAELLQLAFKSIAPGKTKFDLDYLGNQIKAVRDSRIQNLLAEFHAKLPDEAAWKNFCEHFHLPQKDGSAGSRVLSVLMNVGEPKEYKDLSKDGTGAWRKALKGHKGQIVYAETSVDQKCKTKETVQVRPVYAFESQSQVRKELAEKFGDRCRIIGFFQSGCLVEVDKPVVHTKHTLPPGKYRLNTIRTKSKDVKVTTADGKTYPEIPMYNLGSMIAAGFKRV